MFYVNMHYANYACVCFFKQKTAYEMRISDWSSDVCSSDLRDKAAIVRTIQSLAEVLGMKTTAEGVETADQARLLSALGCDFGQGFLFARPLDSGTAFDYWRQSLVKPIL